MSSLYTLTNEMEELSNALWDSLDEETGEVDDVIVNALMVKEEEFNEKAIAVATIQRRFDSRIDEISTEIKRLQAMKKKAENISDRLRQSLINGCERLGKERVDGISASISFRKSERTVIEDESVLPEEFFNVVMTKKPDLTKIKNAIKSGNEVLGARLETIKNIQIK